MGNDTGSHVADGCRVVDINATGAGFLYRLSTDKPGRPPVGGVLQEIICGTKMKCRE